ncbi:MAG TPA: hypothetical protein DE316_07860, partial [Eubacterium sp.]|nr:hypothetical protein [Eubacterium sp.]
FNKVMSSSGNLWVVLRIQQICNTSRHKSPIYGLFKLSKYSQRDNIKKIDISKRGWYLNDFHR